MHIWTETMLARLQAYRPVDKAIPGGSGLMGAVDLARYVSSPLSFARYGAQKYGDVFCTRQAGRTGIIMLGAEASEFVLMNREGAFSSRKAWMAAPMGSYFPNGLLLQDPPDHIQHRRVMQIAFSSDAMTKHLAMMSPAIERSIDQLLDPGQQSKKIKFFPAFKKLTLEFAVKVFLGEELGPEVDSLNKAFLDVVEASGPLNLAPFLLVPGTLGYKGYKARKKLEAYFYGKIEQKKRGNGEDFFSIMCRAETADGHRFTAREIVDHMIFLLMAAHDTSTITSTTLAYHLAKKPAWQERCRTEIAAVENQHPDMNDLAKLTQNEWAIKEALRLQPPLTVYPRVATKDVQYKDVRIKKGNMVILIPSHTHRLPQYWSQPDLFDPERFSTERAEDKSHRFAYLPFGGGAHKCIGMHFGMLEVKSIFLHLLRRYRWELPANYRIRYNNISLGKPWDGLPVTLRRL